MTELWGRPPVVIAQDARCCAVTQQGRYCRRDPVGFLPGWLPGFIQLCAIHATRAAEEKWLHEEQEAIERAKTRLEEERRRAREATVYYVQRTDGLVKIGYTGRLLQYRLTALRAEHGPLVVLATHKGGRDAERVQHARFAAHRVTGEWFTPAPELLAHIERINARRAAPGVAS